LIHPWLLIPVKDLSVAKSSFGKVLTPEERKNLVFAMLEDTVNSAKKVPELGKICVISPDEEIIRLASRLGVSAIKEPGLELNPALEFGIEEAKSGGADSVMIIPADVPLVRPRDFEEIISLADGEKVVVICPSKDSGTNALLLKPPDAIRPSFGGRSFAVHVEKAVKAGVRVRVYTSKWLAFDVDRPEDLIKVGVLAPASKTADFLLSLGRGVFEHKVGPE